MSIPKIIHCCWFGGNKKSRVIKKCIKSWRKRLEGYEIIEWNEKNFDVERHPYCKQAYEAKKWAFVSDYARLWIVYNYGGIYLDTDVEVIKPFDDLLELSCFMGFEHESYIANGLALGAEKGHPFILKNLEVYDHISPFDLDGNQTAVTNTKITTGLLTDMGLKVPCDGTIQTVGDVTIFPREYFSPLSTRNGMLYKTKDTYTIHHYLMSWLPKDKVKAGRKYYKKAKRNIILHNIKRLPNRALRAVIGRERYEKLKSRRKKS